MRSYAPATDVFVSSNSGTHLSDALRAKGLTYDALRYEEYSDVPTDSGDVESLDDKVPVNHSAWRRTNGSIGTVLGKQSFNLRACQFRSFHDTFNLPPSRSAPSILPSEQRATARRSDMPHNLAASFGVIYSIGTPSQLRPCSLYIFYRNNASAF
jgi:hypothetical protein